MSGEQPQENWEAIQAALRERAEAKRVREETAKLHKNARVLADGRFRPRAEDLRRALTRQLAEVDRDHRDRGFYNSTIRLNVRLAERSTYLRNVLEARVRSLTDAYRTAGALPDKAAIEYVHTELQRMWREEEERIQTEVTEETGRSNMGSTIRTQYDAAAHRALLHEFERARQLFSAEVAELELAHGSRARAAALSPPQPVPGGAEHRSAESGRPWRAAQPVGSGAASGIPPAPAPAREPVRPIPAERTAAHAGALAGPWRLRLEHPDAPRRCTLFIEVDGADGRPTVIAQIRGGTAARLAQLVIESPDQDHHWDDLLRTGMARHFWTITSARTLVRTGSRIQGKLPPSLSGRWSQNGESVRWHSR